MSTEQRLKNLNIDPDASLATIEKKLEEKLAQLQKEMGEDEDPQTTRKNTD